MAFTYTRGGCVFIRQHITITSGLGTWLTSVQEKFLKRKVKNGMQRCCDRVEKTFTEPSRELFFELLSLKNCSCNISKYRKMWMEFSSWILQKLLFGLSQQMRDWCMYCKSFGGPNLWTWRRCHVRVLLNIFNTPQITRGLSLQSLTITTPSDTHTHPLIWNGLPLRAPVCVRSLRFKIYRQEKNAWHMQSHL